MISHSTKLIGAALLGFGLFACGNSANITQGTVISATYDPAHAKTKKVCKKKTGTRCVLWTTKSDGWDDADYELELSDGKNTSWVEVDDPDVYQACPVGSQYPACANPKA